MDQDEEPDLGEGETAGDNDVDMKCLQHEEFPLAYLLEETPLQHLLRFAAEERMKAKGTLTTAWEPANLMQEEDISRVIRELSPEHL